MATQAAPPGATTNAATTVAPMHTPLNTNEPKLVLERHVFTPAELHIAAGKRVKLIVENRDDTAEEFDSYDLNREKVIAARSSATIWLGPLKPGRYTFTGEFNVATAHGVVIVQ